MWFYIVKIDKKWIPPLDYVYITTNLFEDGSWFQYCNSLYHAVLMLGGNDVGPRGSFQLLFVFIILILGAIINANIFGNMAVLISAYNRKASIFQEKLETANETMKNLKIPVDIQDDVKSYLTYTQSTLDHQNELDKFLTMLSPSLKREISRHINLDALSHSKIFCNNEEIVNFVINDLDTKLFLPEDEIIRQNSEVKFKPDEELNEVFEDSKPDFTLKLNNRIIDQIDIDKKKASSGFQNDGFYTPKRHSADKRDYDRMSDGFLKNSPCFGSSMKQPIETAKTPPDPFLTNERAFVKVNPGRKKKRRKKSVIELNNISI